MDGDFNLYRHEQKNDSPRQALLIMPLEMIQHLNEEGWEIKPGDIGENITTQAFPIMISPQERFTALERLKSR